MASLSEPLRRHAKETNARRSSLEQKGAAAFMAVTEALVELRAPASIVALSAAAIGEELRHAALYDALARAYGDSADGDGQTPPPRPVAIEIPAYSAAGADGERLLRVIGMCCINETMACAFLELCFARVTAPLPRAAIHEILADEIRHARVGWAYFGCADMGPKERRLVSQWLPQMLSAEWSYWREHITSLPKIDLASHGCPSPTAIEAASLSSIRGLVLPGFARAGVDVDRARAWLDRTEDGMAKA